MLEKTYIKKNKRGTPVLIETNTNIIPIGVAHESGVSESELLEQYDISRAQLHGALSYFYGNRDEIEIYREETRQLLLKYAFLKE